MARSNYKFLYYTYEDIRLFYSKVNNKFIYNNPCFRYRTINSLNTGENYLVHQGNTWVDVNPENFSIGYKLGMFTKTRRPYHFFKKVKKKR